VSVATTIIKGRMGTFDPSTFRDRYQDTLREMIQAKLKGLPLVSQPPRGPQTLPARPFDMRRFA